MTATFSIQGSAELQKALDQVSIEVQAKVNKAVRGTGLELRRNIKKAISSGPASGVTYKKYSPRRTHTASAEGEAPMSDTGRLVNSILFDQPAPMTATVSSDLNYAALLEFTLNRPYFRTSIENIAPKFNARLERAIKGVL